MGFIERIRDYLTGEDLIKAVKEKQTREERIYIPYNPELSEQAFRALGEALKSAFEYERNHKENI